MNTLIRSFKYSGKRSSDQISHMQTIKSTCSPRIFGYTTFALNRIFLPFGLPMKTTEESAAHHLYQKTIKNKRRNSFLMSGENLTFSGKLLMRHKNTQSLTKIFEANFYLSTLVRSFKYSGKRSSDQISHIQTIKSTSSPRTFGYTTFALNWIFCPSGPT